jgi:hypothetical protein
MDHGPVEYRGEPDEHGQSERARERGEHEARNEEHVQRVVARPVPRDREVSDDGVQAARGAQVGKQRGHLRRVGAIPRVELPP